MANLNNNADKAATEDKIRDVRGYGLLLTQSLEAGTCTLANAAIQGIQSGMGKSLDKTMIERRTPNVQPDIYVPGHRDILRAAGKALVNVLNNQDLADRAQKCGLDVPGMGMSLIVIENALSPKITF